jgi:hypothetical protein
VTPATGGSFTAKLTATDLAGNVTTTTGTILVQAQPPASRKHART